MLLQGSCKRCKASPIGTDARHGGLSTWGAVSCVRLARAARLGYGVFSKTSLRRNFSGSHGAASPPR
jgi:hypothetical protein